MNPEDIQAQWQNLKGSLRERWTRFSEQDVRDLRGQADELVRKIEERYGVLREDAERQVEDWVAKLRSDLSLAGKIVKRAARRGTRRVRAIKAVRRVRRKVTARKKKRAAAPRRRPAKKRSAARPKKKARTGRRRR